MISYGIAGQTKDDIIWYSGTGHRLYNMVYRDIPQMIYGIAGKATDDIIWHMRFANRIFEAE